MTTQMKNNSITIRLILMNFLEFAVWGAYLTSLGRYLGSIGMIDKHFFQHSFTIKAIA